MKQIKWGFLLLAVLAAASIAGIGVAVAEHSTSGIVGCVILMFIIMGIGFKRKKKLRENGQL